MFSLKHYFVYFSLRVYTQHQIFTLLKEFYISEEESDQIYEPAAKRRQATEKNIDPVSQ